MRTLKLTNIVLNNFSNLTILKIMPKPKIVFVLGGPGAGKGTQCSKIVEKYGYVHLSAGDLLRAERQNPASEVGKLIEKHITEGTIVPVKITCGLLEKAMKSIMEKDEEKDRFLIDGFPRNEDNLQGWTEAMGEKSILEFVLFFECSEQICIERIMGRSKTSGRTDDNMESLRKRFHTYSNQTKPIIDYYYKLDKVKKVHAENNVDKVFEDVQEIFENK